MPENTNETPSDHLSKMMLYLQDSRLGDLADELANDSSLASLLHTFHSTMHEWKLLNAYYRGALMEVRTKFDVVGSSPIVLKCHYCEKLTDQEHIVII